MFGRLYWFVCQYIYIYKKRERERERELKELFMILLKNKT